MRIYAGTLGALLREVSCCSPSGRDRVFLLGKKKKDLGFGMFNFRLFLLFVLDLGLFGFEIFDVWILDFGFGILVLRFLLGV